MINAILIFNNSGQPRLTKFYSQLETGFKQQLKQEIFHLVSNQPTFTCNFLPLPLTLKQREKFPKCHGQSDNSTASSNEIVSADIPSLVTYRHYATLYFIIISTVTESPLALLDLIQVYVEALDRIFGNVCELDFVFNFEILHATLDEIIIGGIVVQTDLSEIVANVRNKENFSLRCPELPSVLKSTGRRIGFPGTSVG